MNTFTTYFMIFLILITNICISMEVQINTINNCRDLQNMNSKGTYKINQTIDCSGVFPFNPIPLFSGVLLGNNFVIQNVFLNSISIGVGIFQDLSGATIQDLVLLNFTVNTTSNVVCGCLCAVANNTIITNVHLKAPPSSPNRILGGYFVGGLFFISLF